MKKALLIGSGRNLEKQISNIDLKEYDIICGINDIFNPQVRATYEKIGIKRNDELDIYFIAEHSYKITNYNHFMKNINFKKIVFLSPFQLWNQEFNEARKNEISNNRNESFIKIDTAEKSNIIGLYDKPRIGCTDSKLYLSGWASSGMLSLTYLIEELKIDVVSLAGFTFFKGNLIHYYDGAKLINKSHDSKNEKLIFDYYKNLNRVEMINEG